MIRGPGLLGVQIGFLLESELFHHPLFLFLDMGFSLALAAVLLVYSLGHVLTCSFCSSGGSGVRVSGGPLRLVSSTLGLCVL